jgi:predicted membrane-bound spermidine synthase
VRHGLLLLIAAATGAAVMVLELMTVRLMAPWFGQSQVVWTNVIGVVLAALAAGQWLGGRWTERTRAAPVVLLMLAAGVLSFVLPDVVAWLAPLTLPAGLQLDEAWPFVTYGSLLVTLLAVGLPMAALGAVTPWLVRMSREATLTPGRISGAMLGAGTLGSLAGTFGTTHALMPSLGSSWSVRLAGIVLMAIALGLRLLGRQPVARTAVALLLLPLVVPLLPEQAADPSLLAAVETPYQNARIELDVDGTRILRINEGLDSFHSAYRPGEIWTDRYFDAFVGPLIASPRGADGRQRVLVLGLGGGTMARQLVAVSPEVQVTGVELDDAVVRLGSEWLGLPDSVMVHSGVDARIALRLERGAFSALVVDAYSQQIYVPPHLCSIEFFTEVRDRLVTGGIAALNVGGRTREDPVVAAVSGTFARVFPGAVMARVPGTRNMLLIGVRDGAFDVATLEEHLAAAEERAPGIRQRLGWMVHGGYFAPVQPEGAPPLTDDDCPIEALAHEAWSASS